MAIRAMIDWKVGQQLYENVGSVLSLCSNRYRIDNMYAGFNFIGWLAIYPLISFNFFAALEPYFSIFFQKYRKLFVRVSLHDRGALKDNSMSKWRSGSLQSEKVGLACRSKIREWQNYYPELIKVSLKRLVGHFDRKYSVRNFLYNVTLVKSFKKTNFW